MEKRNPEPPSLDRLLETADGKQKAFLSLCLAADTYFQVAMTERAKQSPGPAQAMQALFEEGKAHVAISIQFSAKELHARLALTEPIFTEHLDSVELGLNGPRAAAFANPETLELIDLGKMN